MPFDLPEGWAQPQICELFNLQAGKFIPASDITASSSQYLFPCYGGNGLRGYVKNYSRDGEYPLIGRQGALCGNLNYAIGKFYATEHAIVVECFANTSPRWALYFLEKMNLNQYATATAQPGLSVATINELPIPLPPLAEQHRIVAAIESAFAIIDEIERNMTDLQAAVTAAKAKILSLAIQGKLVPQDSNDEPASALLERIRSEKESLVNAGKIKRSKGENTTPICDDNSPYGKLPQGWALARLGEVCEIARGGSPRPIQDYLTTNENGVSWIKIGDAEQGGKYITATKERITPEGVLRSRMVHSGDFLLTNSMSFGRPYILQIDGCIHDGWLVISNVERVFVQDYLFYLLSSTWSYQVLRKLANGAIVQNLKVDSVKELYLPLPPYAEQHRIVIMVDSTFQHIDRITEALR